MRSVYAVFFNSKNVTAGLRGVGLTVIETPAKNILVAQCVLLMQKLANIVNVTSVYLQCQSILIYEIKREY